MAWRGRALAAAVLVVALALAIPFTAVARPAFVTSVLPADPALHLPHNQDAEPGAAAAPDGTLWATAIHGVQGEGQDVWRSRDGGRSWQWIAAPFDLPHRPGDSPIAGDDGDIAVATAPNSSGRFNVYAASLWAAAGTAAGEVSDISLAISPDDGATWIVHPLAAEVPLDDRPWLAADGACRVYLNYHGGPTVANVVNVYDLCDPVATIAGVTLAPVASTRYPEMAVPAATGGRATYVTVGFGKLSVDTSATSPHRHALYIPMMDCPQLTLPAEVNRAAAVQTSCPGGEHAHVFVAVGSAGATSWTLHDVAESSSSEVPVWPGTIAVADDGTVLFTWHDNHDAFLQRSTDGGSTWSRPLRLNRGGTAVYPTVALGPGTVDVSWYGTDVAGEANDPAVMGLPGAAGSATWSLRWTRSIDGGTTFSRPTIADRAIHTGALCTRGTQCTIPNSRDLLDDFAALVDRASGRPVIVYTSDQPGGTSADRAIHVATR